MVSRVNILSKVPDARETVAQKHFEELGFKGKIKKVSIVDSYTINAGLNKNNLERVGRILANPILETFSVNKISLPSKFNWLVEIGFLPGVTDNIASTARETIEDLLKKKFGPKEGVYSSRVFFIEGVLKKEEIEKIAYSLHNPLIQSARIKTSSQFKKDRGLSFVVPQVKLKSKTLVSHVNLNVPDEELARIGKQGILDKDGLSRGPLALDLEYMKAIREYFKSKGRPATDIELESIAQTWSEHCKHTIFANPIDEIQNGLYKSYIKEATRIIRAKKGKKDFCVSVFTDNAGGIIFDERYIVSHKVETHNSPSALDPFGGAITGIVGVNRDAMGFGMGAKPIANVYGFCLADPKDTRPLYRDSSLTQRMLAPRRIMNGVIQGVNTGGNCSGIPTAQGFVYFHDRFRGKPLVFVGTVGLMPRKTAGRDSIKKAAKVGDYIVMVGGRVGQDGIHGATFSSQGIDAASPATAVQIGDPITQKKMSDTIVKEARDLGLYNSITDNGAGGISCSVAEMAKECGGCEVKLDKVPLKYPGLEPWKIWISESQERMTLAVPKNKWNKFRELMKSRGVEATIIGTFTKSGKCVVRYSGKIIMDIDLEFLHNGLPKKYLVSQELNVLNLEPPIQKIKNLNPVIRAMLKRLNIGSYEFISNQYDHEVQASSVLKPLQGRGRVNADVAVLRPVLDSNRGIVLSSALAPAYSEIDSYKMAAGSIDTAIRTTVAAGADIDNLALLDNFCWCSSNDPTRLYQLKKAAKACYDYAILYGTPFISGKDSMFNDFKGYDGAGNPISISIPPTLLISTLGVINDVTKVNSIDFKFANDLIYILGETYNELGGSEYFAYLGERDKKDYLGNNVPGVGGHENKKLYKAFARATQKELVASAISIGRGGIAVSLAKAAMAGSLGADISLKLISKHTSADDFTLFSESQGRILASVSPGNRKMFEKTMGGIPYFLVGKVNVNPIISIKGRSGNKIVGIKVAEGLKAYKATFKDF